MTLRELLERERDRAAEELSDPAGIKKIARRPVVLLINKDAENILLGFNHALELLWPCVEALEKYRGQASSQQKGPTFYSEADEAFAELNNKLNKEEKHGTKT